MKLSQFYIVPGYTFFYWGFSPQKAVHPEYQKFFSLSEGSLHKPIEIIINNKKYNAQIRIARINNKGKIKNRSNKKYPEREVVQIFYDRELDTLKALRKLCIYSYAATIDKSKPKLKELLEFNHVKENIFKIKVISKQETDFDKMFHFLEDKNLLAFWRDETLNKKKKDKLFISYSDKWINKKNIGNYANRANVIYILNNSSQNKLYIGKADVLGNRVREHSSSLSSISNNFLLSSFISFPKTTSQNTNIRMVYKNTFFIFNYTKSMGRFGSRTCLCIVLCTLSF